jgi:tetratricopeptide (TPR) repeat protein
MRVHAAVKEGLELWWQQEILACGPAPEKQAELGRLYYDMGRLPEAVEVIQRVGNDDANLRFLLARCFKEMGRYDLSLRLLRALSEQDARRVSFELGTLQEVVGDLDGAIETYKNLQQIDLSFPGLNKRIENIGSTTMLHLRGKIAVPIRPYLSGHALIPMYVRNTEVEQWVKQHRKTLSPSLANPHNDRAVVHLFSGQWKAADEELVLAQNLDPGLTAVQVNWASLCMLRGDWNEAEEHVTKAQNLFPRLPALLHLRGLIHAARSEYAQAIPLWQHLLGQERRHGIVALNLGDALYSSGKVHAAVLMWEHFLRACLLPELACRRLREVRFHQYRHSLLTPFRPDS